MDDLNFEYAQTLDKGRWQKHRGLEVRSAVYRQTKKVIVNRAMHLA